MNFEEILKAKEQQKSFATMEVKKIDEDKKTIEVVMSSNSIDRHGDIVLQSGMEIPKQTKSITVFVDHDHTIEKTIGKVDIKNITTKGSKTSGLIEFATEINPLAELTFKLMKAGYVTDVSIGFIPKAYDTKKVKQEDGSTKEVWRWTEWELIELSVVGIGSNRDAMKKAFKDGKINKEELKCLGIEEEKEDNSDRIEKALLILEKNHSITKSYRKAFKTISKTLAIDYEAKEEDNINKLVDFITLNFSEQADPVLAKKEIRTISDIELKKMIDDMGGTV